ncbi:ABC transporter permease [Pseudomonas sp. 102515]|uniref:ABC transporter permease n=1 Tax=Pseudomonas sp. 102515 TaxID=3071568 RepID=UPI00280265EF|nr:ABC transporter permease [Pseudomonas sp. 102515]MDQ7914261.1 ABC transporter permease [Pseudomonas sp. 102515]
MLGMFRSVIAYREFILSSIRNEFLTRFSRSKLGGLWMIINPLVQVAIYAIILSNVLSAKLPGIQNKYAYAIYLIAGTLGWTLFSEIVGRCLTLFIDQGNLMKKMRFPKIALPVIVVGSATLNNILLLVSALVVFLLMGHYPGWNVFWLLPLTLVVIALATGVGLLLGVLNVFVRDVGQVVPIILQLLFWFTPIVYPASIIPETLRPYLSWNPLVPVIEAYHQVLVFNSAPDSLALLTVVCVASLLLLIGLFVFRRASPEMVDAL